jgi:hypothetical protein
LPQVYQLQVLTEHVGRDEFEALGLSDKFKLLLVLGYPCLSEALFIAPDHFHSLRHLFVALSLHESMLLLLILIFQTVFIVVQLD